MVENLYEEVDELEHGELIVELIAAQSEVKTCIPTINDLVVSKLKEVCHLGIPLNDHPVSLGFNPSALLVRVSHIPSRQSGFALSILEQNKPDLGIN